MSFTFFLINVAQPTLAKFSSVCKHCLCLNFRMSFTLLSASHSNSRGKVGQDPLGPKLLFPSRRAVGISQGLGSPCCRPRGCDTWDQGWPVHRSTVGKGWTLPRHFLACSVFAVLRVLFSPATLNCPEKCHQFAVGLLRILPCVRMPGAEGRTFLAAL